MANANREKELAQGAKDLNLGPKLAREMRKFDESENKIIEQGILHKVLEDEINSTVRKGIASAIGEETLNNFAELVEEMGIRPDNDSNG